MTETISLPTAVAAQVQVETGTSRTLTAADNTNTVRCTNAAAVTVTVPTDASNDLPTGFIVVLVSDGAGGVALDVTGITLQAGGVFTAISTGEGLWLQKTGVDSWIVLGGTV